MDIEQWKVAFTKALENPPGPGSELTGKDGEVRLNLDMHEGKEPYIFGFMYLNNVVGEEPIWYARSVTDEAKFGWKLILLPQVKARLLRERGMNWSHCGVLGIRIVREAKSGKSLLCDVVEA